MTRFSFTSSNSSFSECVRNDHLHFLPSSSNTYGVTSDIKWWEAETFNNNTKNVFSSSSATNYKFTDCRWAHCSSSSDGGAIRLTSSGSTLTILRGTFIDCNTTCNFGGGVFVDHCEKLDAENSLFYQCHATTNRKNLGGAGICIHNCSTTNHIARELLFIDCDCESDAGGMTLHYCKGTQIEFPIQSSQFIKCRSLTFSPDGGAICYAGNNVTVGVQNCLFSQCSATNGGGIWTDICTRPSAEVIKFCFFHANTVTGKGKDVCLCRLESNYMPFLHCMTTSSENTVGEYENTNDHSDWLPLGTLSYPNPPDEAPS